jgi:hypothetical protein
VFPARADGVEIGCFSANFIVPRQRKGKLFRWKGKLFYCTSSICTNPGRIHENFTNFLKFQETNLEIGNKSGYSAPKCVVIVKSEIFACFFDFVEGFNNI